MDTKFWLRVKLIYGVVSALAVIAVYIRWQTLTGQGFGHGLAAAAVLFLTPYMLLEKKLSSRLAGVALISVGSLFLYVTIFPLDWDPGIQHRIDFWQYEQRGRRALAKCFREGKYYHLSVSVLRTKTLWYNVSGTLKDREDVEHLRALIKAEKPSISIDQVNWDLRFTSDGSKLVGNDRGLFKSDYEEVEIKQ